MQTLSIAIGRLCFEQDRRCQVRNLQAGALVVGIHFLYASENTGTGMEAALFLQSVRLLIAYLQTSL